MKLHFCLMDAVNYHPTARGSNTAKCSNIKNMNINEILKTGANVQLVINALDLKEAFLAWSEEAKAEKTETPEGSYLSREEAAEKLNVDVATLWRWNRSGYLCNIKRGGKVYYRLSDLEKFMEG